MQTLVRATADTDRLADEVFDGSCERVLLYFWNRKKVRDTVLNLYGPIFDEKVP